MFKMSKGFTQATAAAGLMLAAAAITPAAAMTPASSLAVANAAPVADVVKVSGWHGGWGHGGWGHGGRCRIVPRYNRWGEIVYRRVCFGPHRPWGGGPWGGGPWGYPY